MKRVFVHIESLVIDDRCDANRKAIADQMRAELALVLGMPRASGQLGALSDVSRVNAGRVRLREHADAGRVGTDIARAIGKALLG